MRLLLCVLGILRLSEAQTYTKIGVYKDTSCTILERYVFYPESTSGTCTNIGWRSSSSNVYSIKCDGSVLNAYSSVDCSGSAAGTMSSVNTVMDQYYTECAFSRCLLQCDASFKSKVLEFGSSYPTSNYLIHKAYTGTDATTSSCSLSPYTGETRAYEYGTCHTTSGTHNSLSYTSIVINSCSGSSVTATGYSDDNCGTQSFTGESIPITNFDSTLAFTTCTVSNDGSTTAGSYESAIINECLASSTGNGMNMYLIINEANSTLELHLLACVSQSVYRPSA